MLTPRLPAVDRTDAPADLNGLLRLGERRKLVSARVPSCSARAIHLRLQCELGWQAEHCKQITHALTQQGVVVVCVCIRNSGLTFIT